MGEFVFVKFDCATAFVLKTYQIQFSVLPNDLLQLKLT